MSKRRSFLAIALSFALAFSMMPVSSADYGFADEDQAQTDTQDAVTSESSDADVDIVDNQSELEDSETTEDDLGALTDQDDVSSKYAPGESDGTAQPVSETTSILDRQARQSKKASKKTETLNGTTGSGESSGTGSGGQTSIRSIVWDSASNNYSISDDGKTLDATAVDNGVSYSYGTVGAKPYIVTAQIDFSNSANLGYDVGDVQIRLPKSVFSDRDGNPADEFKCDLPMAPDVADELSFNYSYEDSDGDGVDDTVLITNCKTINGEIKFQALVSWNYLPSNVADGAEADVRAEFTVKEADGSVTKSEDKLIAKNHTSSSLSTAQKTAWAIYHNWEDSWGTKPADADDYFYILWQGFNTTRTNGTQPYYVYYTEPDDADVVGGFRAGLRYVSSSYDATSYQPVGTLSEYDENGAGFNAAGSPDSYLTPVTGTSQQTDSAYLLLRYKKSDYSAGDEITNTVTVNLQGEDGCTDQKTATAKYTYYPEDYDTYTGDLYTASKFWQSGNYANDLQRILDGKSVSFYVYCQNSALAKAWGLTKTEDGYGQKDYTAELIDDFVAFGDSNYGQLTKDDYHFDTLNSFKPEIWTYDKDPDDKTAVRTVISDPTILVKTRTNDSWHEYVAAVDDEDKVYAAKLSYTGRAHTVRLFLRVRVIVDSTESTRAQAQKMIDANPNNPLMNITNINTLTLQDADGNYVGPTSRYNLGNHTNGVRAHDAAEGLTPAFHQSATKQIQDFPYNYSISKNTVDGADSTFFDPITQTQTMRYSLSISNDQGFDNDWRSDPDLEQRIIDSGRMDIYNNQTFYDLLPAGAYFKEGSVTVNSSKGELSDSEYSVRTVENWRGSGRTMLIITVNVDTSQGDNLSVNFNSNLARYITARSQLAAYFSLTYPMESIVDYGKTVRNDFAVMSGDGEYKRGSGDYGGNSQSRSWYADLDESGSQNDAGLKFKYSNTVNKSLGVNESIESGYTKKVRSYEHGSAGYVDNTDTVGGGYYDYQLRFATDARSGFNKDIVMYDVIERDHGDSDNWKGTFVGVDTSQPESKGVKPVVYYSTADLGNSASDAQGWKDLSDTSIWSTTAPSDLSTVTAVAFDLSKDKNGDDYVIQGAGSLVVKILMQAPYDLSEEAAEELQKRAYNRPWISRTSWTSAGGPDSATTNLDAGNRTTIKYKDPIDIDKTSDPESGTADEPAGVQRGDKVTYTVTATNKSIANDLEKVVIQDVVPSGMTVDAQNIKVSYDGGESGLVDDDENVALDVSGQTLKFTVSKLAPEQVIAFTIPVAVDGDAHVYVNKAEVTSIDDREVSFESDPNYHQLKTKFTVSKIWDDQEDKFQTRPSSIKVQLYADDEIVEGKTATLNEGNNWTYTFRDLVACKEDDTRIVYSAKEVEVPKGYEESYADVEDGIDITNSADVVESGDATFKVRKLRTDSTIAVEGAEFVLKDENDVVQYTATTNKGGEATFVIEPDVTRESVSYVLEETSAPDGYTKTDETWNVTFTRGQTPKATLNSNNVFEAVWNWIVSVVSGNNYDGSANTLTVYNEYEAEGQFELGATKTLRDHELEAGDFSFTVREGNTIVATGSNDADGTVTFTPITYSMINNDRSDLGVHTYTITEDAGTMGGVTYDKASHTVVVNVTDNGDGTLDVERRSAPAGGVSFTNVYEAKGEIKLQGNKELNGRALNNGEFAFAITEDGKSVASGKNNVDGTIDFEKIEYTLKDVGTHTYTISETNNSLGGITYDESTFEVVVTVTDNGDGTLNTDAVYPDDGVVFKNDYAATGDLSLVATKTLDGRSLKANEFNFELSEDGTVISTVSNDEDGRVAFDKIDYTLADVGTHTYTISEVKEELGGVTYDETTHTVTVNVSDNGDGTLEVERQVYPEGGLVFANVYEATGEIELEGTKNLAGRDLNEGEFAFTVSEDGNTIATGKNAADGKISFSTISYTLADVGTHTYTITEDTGELGGITYDDTSHEVIVTVSDNGDGTLSASVAYPDNGVVFNNSYESVGELALEANKTLSGRDLEDGEFTFRVAEDGKVVATGTNDADGKIVFSTITYKAAGEHTYTVSEVKGKAKGITYDDTTYTVDVTVTDDGKGALTAKASDAANSMSFDNSYDPGDTKGEDRPKSDDTDPGNSPSSDDGSSSVDTGDDAHLTLLAVMLALALSGLLGAEAIRRRARKE